MNEKTKQQNSGVKTTYNRRNTLFPDEFRELYTFLNIIKHEFSDFCIVNGHFRSRNNDLTNVVETYFDYFKGMEFIIADVKQTFKLLSTLEKNADITVVIDKTVVSFTDGYQTVKAAKMDEEVCDNKFISVDLLDDIFSNNIDYNKPLIRERLSKGIVSNLAKACRDLNSSVITFTCDASDPNEGYMHVRSSSGLEAESPILREYTIKLQKKLLTAMDKDHYFSITTLPYTFNQSEMTLDFKFFIEQNILAIIHHTKIGNLSITIYGRASYVADSG